MENDEIAFKVQHYSVTESAGIFHATIVKKVSKAVTFGVRTVDNTAVKGKEYEAMEEIITMQTKDTERTVDVKIRDNTEWGPDMEFHMELFDPSTKERLMGDDTFTRVTILDEDFPGKLGFEYTEMEAARTQDKV